MKNGTKLVPTNRLVALAVPHTVLVFDADKTIRRYGGRVPPLEEVRSRFKALDATVMYAQASDASP